MLRRHWCDALLNLCPGRLHDADSRRGLNCVLSCPPLPPFPRAQAFRDALSVTQRLFGATHHAAGVAFNNIGR